MQGVIFTESHAGIVIGAYTVLNLLLLFLLDHWLCNSSVKYCHSVARRVIVCFLFIAISFLPVLALFIRDGLYKYYLERYSYIWMGFLMYFGALILVLTLIELIVRLIAKIAGKGGSGEPSLAGRVISGVLIVLMIGGSVGINVYGMRHARETVVTRYTVAVDKAVKHTKSLRAAFISDLHLSYNSDPSVIQQMVEQINSEKPDIVFVGGDMFTSSYDSVRDPKEYIKTLRGIKAKDGVYWVYGNHDVEEPLFCGFAMTDPEDARRTKKMKRFLKRSGFRILEDRQTAICKGEVQLVGRADKFMPVKRAEKRKAPDELLTDLDKEKPIIVLAHEADELAGLADSGADVLFSGHTHNGQIFPGNYIIKLFHDVAYGKADIDGMTVIVSSGVGCYGPPIRVLTDSEIVIADINFN